MASEELTDAPSSHREHLSGRQFVSVLFQSEADARRAEEASEPDFFHDLNLDQVVSAITSGQAQHQLEKFLWAPLRDENAVLYRHDVLRDLDDQGTRLALTQFAKDMQHLRDLVDRSRAAHYRYERQRWHLDAIECYCDAIHDLNEGLAGPSLRSAGLKAVRTFTASYLDSSEFNTLRSDARAVREALDSVQYTLLIRDNRITVFGHEFEGDYSADVEHVFEKFKQGHVQGYQPSFSTEPQLNHIEAGVLDRVAQLFPSVFDRLNGLRERTSTYVDPTIRCVDRELRFYLSYRELQQRVTRGTLRFCLPVVSSEDKGIDVKDAYDLALALKLGNESPNIVTNNVNLNSNERIAVISGPNQGGKSTYARTFGQLHYLASLGLPIPASSGAIFLCDAIFTHFERAEYLTDLSGKLQDDLKRVHDILARASSESVLVLNEIFSSTSLADATYLGQKIFEKIQALDALCVCVTFVEELSRFSSETVSLAPQVDPRDPAVRTFKVVRQKADGQSYSASLASRHHLTRSDVARRVGP